MGDCLQALFCFQALTTTLYVASLALVHFTGGNWAAIILQLGWFQVLSDSTSRWLKIEKHWSRFNKSWFSLGHFILSPIFQMLHEAILAGWPLLWSGLSLFFMTQLTPPFLRSRSTTKHWVKCCSFLLTTAWMSGMRCTILIMHILVPWLEQYEKNKKATIHFLSFTWSQIVWTLKFGWKLLNGFEGFISGLYGKHVICMTVLWLMYDTMLLGDVTVKDSSLTIWFSEHELDEAPWYLWLAHRIIRDPTPGWKDVKHFFGELSQSFWVWQSFFFKVLLHHASRWWNMVGKTWLSPMPSDLRIFFYPLAGLFVWDA